MSRLLLIFFVCITNICIAQIDTSIDLSKRISVKELCARNNYVNDTIRGLIIDYLKSKQLDPKEYFIESDISHLADTLHVALWDLTGIKKINEMKRKAEANKREFEQLIGLIGNPGKCGTIYYDTRLKKVIGFYYWQ